MASQDEAQPKKEVLTVQTLETSCRPQWKPEMVDIDSFHHFVISTFISKALCIPHYGQSLLAELPRN